MLDKLLKYDLKFNYKNLLIFIVLAIISAIITRVLTQIGGNSSIIFIVAKIWQGVAISMMVSALVNCLMRNWVRFTKNLYGDESYLTHTLPVTNNKIYLAKFLCAIITMFSAVLTILICVAIMFYSKENIEALKNTFQSIAIIYNINIIELILVVFIVFFLEMFSILLSGYTGLIIGHKFADGKIIKSVIIGFISYTIIQCITLFGIYIMALFNQGVMGMFTSTQMANIDTLKSIMYLGVILYIVYAFVYYLLDVKLLNRGVNVD